jgi:N-acetylglucosaminyl-diphospho-decaprenol L-rhamnosyltransferase
VPEIAAVIGNYEGERHLPDCLSSLAAQSVPPAETIVVDAESRDRSAAVAAEHGARVLAVPNRGLGALYNAGARAASARYVLLANNDVAFEPRCLELLAAALDEDGRRFAADPVQMDWEGERLVHGRSALRRGPLLRVPLPGLALDQTLPADGIVPTVLANGGAMLVRREPLLRLGGFDETFFMDFEDLDLCWRAWLGGWECVHVPGARLRHRVGAVTTSAVLPRRLASSHHNLLRFALKCLPARAAALVVVGELLRLPRHPRPIARGLAQVARELPELVRLQRNPPPRGRLLDWFLAGQPGPAPVESSRNVRYAGSP